MASFTPALAAAALYAGLNALLLMVLAMRVVRRRRAGSISLGDGGDADLNRAMRAHGNAAETMPLALILITIAALAGAPAAAIHSASPIRAKGASPRSASQAAAAISAPAPAGSPQDIASGAGRGAGFIGSVR